MKKLFLVLFSVFLISCSTDIPEEKEKSDIKEPLVSYNEWLKEVKNNPPIYVYSPGYSEEINGVLQEVIYCEGSGKYRTTKEIDLNKCQSHEFECTTSDCKDVKKYIIIGKADYGVVPSGESTKEEVYQDRIYTCKYCSFRYRIHHNKNYQTEFFNDFLKKLEKSCPARPKE